jgi:hypothetical protein
MYMYICVNRSDICFVLKLHNSGPVIRSAQALLSVCHFVPFLFQSLHHLSTNLNKILSRIRGLRDEYNGFWIR